MMSTCTVLIFVAIGILVICPVVADVESLVGLDTTTQDNVDDAFDQAKLTVNANVSTISTLNLTADSRALYDQVKSLLSTENMTDEERFNEFKILLAKSTAILFDKLEIEPQTTATATEDGKFRQKRAAKKNNKKRKFWFNIFVEGGW